MKRVLCLLLAALATVSLTACKDRPPVETAGTTELAPTTAPTEATVPETTASSEPTEPPVLHTVYFWTEKKVTNTDGGSAYKRTYDDKGNRLTDTFASNDGKAGHGSSFTYDATGNMLTHDSYDNYSTGHAEFTYDAAGRKVGETFSNSEGYFATTEYIYREDGLLAEWLFHYDKTEDQTTYTYDDKGNLLKKQEIITINGKRIQETVVEYTYDGAGNKLSEFNSSGFRSEWTYDDRGNVLSSTDMDNDGSIRNGVLYEYDQQDRVVIQYLFENDPKKPTEKFIYEYDEAGKLTVKYLCTPNSSKQNASGFCRYTYDENGNLLSEVTTKKDGTEVSRTEYTYIAMELPVK